MATSEASSNLYFVNRELEIAGQRLMSWHQRVRDTHRLSPDFLQNLERPHLLYVDSSMRYVVQSYPVGIKGPEDQLEFRKVAEAGPQPYSATFWYQPGWENLRKFSLGWGLRDSDTMDESVAFNDEGKIIEIIRRTKPDVLFDGPRVSIPAVADSLSQRILLMFTYGEDGNLRRWTTIMNYANHEDISFEYGDDECAGWVGDIKFIDDIPFYEFGGSLYQLPGSLDPIDQIAFVARHRITIPLLPDQF